MTVWRYILPVTRVLVLGIMLWHSYGAAAKDSRFCMTVTFWLKCEMRIYSDYSEPPSSEQRFMWVAIGVRLVLVQVTTLLRAPKGQKSSSWKQESKQTNKQQQNKASSLSSASNRIREEWEELFDLFRNANKKLHFSSPVESRDQ